MPYVDKDMPLNTYLLVLLTSCKIKYYLNKFELSLTYLGNIYQSISIQCYRTIWQYLGLSSTQSSTCLSSSFLKLEEKINEISTEDRLALGKVKDVCWRMKAAGWKLNGESWRVKAEGLKLKTVSLLWLGFWKLLECSWRRHCTKCTKV